MPKYWCIYLAQPSITWAGLVHATVESVSDTGIVLNLSYGAICNDGLAAVVVQVRSLLL